LNFSRQDIARYSFKKNVRYDGKSAKLVAKQLKSQENNLNIQVISLDI